MRIYAKDFLEASGEALLVQLVGIKAYIVDQCAINVCNRSFKCRQTPVQCASYKAEQQLSQTRMRPSMMLAIHVCYQGGGSEPCKVPGVYPGELGQERSGANASDSC